MKYDNNIGYVEVFFEEEETPIIREKGLSDKIKYEIDFNKYWGEDLRVIYTLDKRIDVSFAGIGINVPINKFKIFEQECIRKYKKKCVKFKLVELEIADVLEKMNKDQ